MGNRLAIAWGKAFEGIKVWHAGDAQASTVLLAEAAEELEALPLVFDGARVRRQLAGRLADLGDREGALRELRTVHDAFLKMKAEGELQKTREMFRELDVRPPSRSTGAGAGGLTQRELEIARLVALGRSDKAVAKELDIARRTVSTHLSNIYRKLELGSRGELAAYVAENNLLERGQVS
jgi:DNA-binding NarL/FixJ family response regulator